MYKLIFTDSYTKLLHKWLKKHPDLKARYVTTIQLLELNPYHNSLRLHKLQGKLSEFYSVSIDIKNRIIIDFIVQDSQIILLNIGNHDIYRAK